MRSIDPYGVAARRLGSRASQPVTLGGVYSARNARYARKIAGEAERAGWSVRLWALDDVSPQLADVTVGQGPGGRFQNLNALLDDVDPAHVIVIVDDDFTFRRGNLVALAGMARLLGFDLAQPARLDHFAPHPITLRQPWMFARETTFVEIGPVVAISPRIRPRVMPFPEVTTMGWGTELLWWDLLAEGFTFGVVDALPVTHVGRPATAYAHGPETAHARDLFAERGLSRMSDIQQVRRSIRRLPGR